MVIGTSLGLHDLATVVLSIVLAFVFGYALTVRSVLRSGLDLRTALKVALAADTASIAVMEVIDNAIMLAVPGAMDAGTRVVAVLGCAGLLAGRGVRGDHAVQQVDDRPRQGARGRARVPLRSRWPRRAVDGRGSDTAAAYALRVAADLDALLEAAVAGVGGTERPGQVEMAHAVADAVESGEHLLVQAGTGTGKSLAYLVPAVRACDGVRASRPWWPRRHWPCRPRSSTATCRASRRPWRRCSGGGRPTRWSRGGATTCARTSSRAGSPTRTTRLLAVDQVSATASRLGAEVVRLREWADATASGDRDELVPGVSDRAWRQVSVSAHECLGGKCPVVAECFVERSREAAKDVDVVVTNHSFMAIDAFENRQMLPEHDVLVIDEAHELVDRVTATITDEVSSGMVTSAAPEGGQAGRRHRRGDRRGGPPRGRARRGRGGSDRLALGRVGPGAVAGAGHDPGGPVRAQAGTGGAGRRSPTGGSGGASTRCTRTPRGSSSGASSTCCGCAATRGGDRCCNVAPMSVAMLVRDRVFADRTCVLTSATLELGGSFDAVAGTIGLRGEGAPAWRGHRRGEPVRLPAAGHRLRRRATSRPRAVTGPRRRCSTRSRRWFGRPAVGRSGCSRRCVRRRARRSSCGRGSRSDGTAIPILCQGEDQISTLVRQFAREPATCLFGTLTLWQGVDVPGSSCQLVVIDRIPFPRPDDPLASARSEAIARMGGNGFMAVSATHAALRLAQGSGRLVRRSDDRGVVAILDSRMVNARYASFLQRSLPPFWPTTDRELVLAALKRLDEVAPPPMPVTDPALRGFVGALEGAAVGGDALEPGVDHRPVAGPPPVPPSPRTAVTVGHAWTAEPGRGAAGRGRGRGRPGGRRRPARARGGRRHSGAAGSAGSSWRTRGHRRTSLSLMVRRPRLSQRSGRVGP